MATLKKGKNLRNQYLRASSLFLVVFLLSATKCNYDPSGTTVLFVYPKENIANKRVINNGCPVKVSEPTTQELTDFESLVCLSPKEAAEFRREFEAKCK